MSKTFIEEQSEIRLDYNPKPKKRNYLLLITRQRATSGVFTILLFALIVPFLIYYLAFDRNIQIQDDPHTCSVNKTYRIQCGLENATPSYCERIGCCFDNSTRLCYHTSPARYNYDTGSPSSPKVRKTPFGTQMERVYVVFEEIDPNRLKIILRKSPGTNINLSTFQEDQKKYLVLRNSTEKFFSVQVARKNGSQLFTTSKGPLIISEKYWEWSFQLTSEFLYGFGESLLKISKDKPFNKVIYPSKSDHDSLPMIMAYHDKSFHGLKIHHDGPLEMTILSSGIISVKSLAGDTLEFELFLGPTPKDIFSQQLQSTKNPRNLDSLDNFGLHLCPSSNITNMSTILEEYTWAKSNLGVDFDTHCIHKNVFTSLLVTKEPPLDEIKKAVTSKPFVLHLPPQLPVNTDLYNLIMNNSKTRDIFYQCDNNMVFFGKYLNYNASYPNFESKGVEDYVGILLNTIKTLFGIVNRFALIDNWPREDSYHLNKTDSRFPYLSKDLSDSMSYTIPWSIGDHMRHHNKYGAMQLQALAKLSNHSFIMTASHTFDSTPYVFIQEYETSWEALKKAIKKTIASSIFGNFYLSIPVCGSQAHYDVNHESLCMRWFLFSVTSPLFRYAPSFPTLPSSRAKFSQMALNTFKEAVELRRTLLCYYRTILSKGEPLLRPMFYNYHDDQKTFELDEQFMVGNDLVVAHPLLPGQTELKVYLPPSEKVWFEFAGGFAYDSLENGWLSLDVVETDFVAFIKAGVVIPLVKKENPPKLSLIVALSCSQNECEAKGDLIHGGRFYSIVSNKNETRINYSQSQPANEGDEDILFEKITLYRFGQRVGHILKNFKYDKTHTSDVICHNKDLC